MPLLYVLSPSRVEPQFKVYDRNLRPVDSGVFDKFKIKDLSPFKFKPWVAVFWHFRSRNHSIISWVDDKEQEHTVFIPGILSWQEALAVSREEFKDRKVIPPATYFRFTNYEGPYLLD